MQQRTIGGSQVGEIGLGCMGMSWAYGAPNDQESLQVLARSIELGVNHWDTADLYGAGENEKLLSTALKGTRDKVFLATKFGNVYDRSITSHQDQVAKNAPWIVDGTPEYVHRCIDLSLQRLQVESVDLYYQHRVDPEVPIEETVGAMAELVKEGKVKNLGLSEASAETIKKAHAVHPIAAVQSEFSLWTREYENDVIPLCAELGIAFVPYSPLGRGFLTGSIKKAEDLPEDDWRRSNPRFQGENLIQNLRIVEVAEKIATERGVSPGQVALAWVLMQGNHILPIPGTKRLRWLEENASAANVVLTSDDLVALDDAAPAQGNRYPDVSMAFVNK
jgi:aryl-alcohol dehydrogenase-like predicted oxidoreductase